MPKKQSPNDLSTDELRWLLVEKRRAERQKRIERYRKTGRALMVAPHEEGTAFEAWRTQPVSEPGETPPASAGKRLLEVLLVLVEIGAVAGFIFLLFSFFSTLRELNREVIAAVDLPTLTPTPLIVAVVLPSGHTPPDSPGGAQYNEAEIPEHLRPLVQSIANVPVPTSGPEQAIRIQIEAIHVNQQVVQGDSWEQLKHGVGQLLGTVNPGQKGNLVLSAHNDIFGETFRDLDQLKPGDEVILYTAQRSYTYLVSDTKIVEPTAVEVMGPSTQTMVTLISCYPYLVDNKRIVVTAVLR